MAFRISGLSPEPFQPLFGLSNEALAERGVRRMIADAANGFPCRITLADAEPGETVLLLNHEHQPADTPFRSRHAIFVREGADRSFDAVDTVPDQLRRRTLSLRAFDWNDMMIDADLCEGTEAEALITRLLGDPRTAYIHAHFARHGCYAALIERG